MGEFKRNNRTIYTRTVSTLRKDRVSLIKKTLISGKDVTILKLTNVNRIHYIVYFDDDLTDEMMDWDDVIVLTEIEFLFDKFRLCIKPSIQFPNLNLNDQEIYDHLKNILT